VKPAKPAWWRNAFFGGGTMSKPGLADELRVAIEPLLPVRVLSPNGGHPRVSDLTAITGIVYLL
jgi:hypothetical protein